MARLLVVDDEEDILDLVVRRMVQAGHQVLAADNAVLALALAEQHGAPDAVILDVDMPGMDGFMLLDRLRQRLPGLPALFLTVLWSGDVHTRMKNVDAGYLPKPFTATQLRAGVQQLLDGNPPAARPPA